MAIFARATVCIGRGREVLSQVVIAYSRGHWGRTTCDAYPDGWTFAAEGWRAPTWHSRLSPVRATKKSESGRETTALAQAGAFDFVGNRSILEIGKVPPLRKAVTFPQNAKMTGFWGVQQQYSAYPHMWGAETLAD